MHPLACRNNNNRIEYLNTQNKIEFIFSLQPAGWKLTLAHSSSIKECQIVLGKYKMYIFWSSSESHLPNGKCCQN